MKTWWHYSRTRYQFYIKRILVGSTSKLGLPDPPSSPTRTQIEREPARFLEYKILAVSRKSNNKAGGEVRGGGGIRLNKSVVTPWTGSCCCCRCRWLRQKKSSAAVLQWAKPGRISCGAAAAGCWLEDANLLF